MAFSWISIGLGTIFLIFGLKKCIDTRRIIPKRLQSRWNVILSMMVFFVISYLFSLVILFNEDLHMMLMGLVYLLGGGFVAIISSLTSKTIYAISENEEIKKLNEKLEEKNDFLNNVIESLNHPFYVIDAKTYRIKLANSSTRLGKSDSASTCYELTHRKNEPCGSKEHICPLEEVKRTGKPVTVEHIHHDGEGHTRNVEIHAHPIFDANGNIVEMIEYSLDITKRKKAEMEIRKLNEKLLIAKKDLENLLEQKNEFIHILSHDLKNPLTSPMALLPMLEEKIEDETSKKMVKAVLHSFEMIKSIIYDTLKLARLDNLEKSLSIEKVNLYDIVVKSISDNKKMIEKYHFSVENELPEDLVVDADKFLIGQVFNNLISNAIKYTQEDQDQRVIISSKLVDDSLVLSVKDFGRGIKRGQENILFDKFSKFAKPREGFDSTGLGLSICKGIVDHHGGRIWAVSKGLGKGSTFYFTLPLDLQQQTYKVSDQKDSYHEIKYKVDNLLMEQ